MFLADSGAHVQIVGHFGYIHYAFYFDLILLLCQFYSFDTYNNVLTRREGGIHGEGIFNLSRQKRGMALLCHSSSKYPFFELLFRCFLRRNLFYNFFPAFLTSFPAFLTSLSTFLTSFFATFLNSTLASLPVSIVVSPPPSRIIDEYQKMQTTHTEIVVAMAGIASLLGEQDNRSLLSSLTQLVLGFLRL